MRRVTVFIAHKAQALPSVEALQWLSTTLEKKMTARIGPCSVALVSGREDYQHYFHGNWDDWTRGIPMRRHAITGKRLYDLFVCPDATIGRATASILNACIALDRTVLYVDTDAKRMKRVLGTACMDDNDWASGYQLITDPPTSETP